MSNTPDVYDVDGNDRMALNRLRSAATRGDTRAKATLAHLEQQQHADKWAAAEKARADRAAEIASRTRPSDVATVMTKLRKERDEKAARTKATLDQLDAG